MTFVKSSTKAGRLLLKALPKLYKNRMAFVKRSLKAGWLSLKALWKQDDFRRKLYERRIRMTFVKSSAVRKRLKKSINCDNIKFCDQQAYVGGPSFRRRPWPFGQPLLPWLRLLFLFVCLHILFVAIWNICWSDQSEWNDGLFLVW